MITSRQNERIKAFRALQKRTERERTGLHLIEGNKLVWEALQSGAEISLVLAETETDVPDGVEVLYVSESVMETVSTQKTPQSLCAAVKTPGTVCPDSFPRGMIIALDCLQDPGNLGTIIRTADAFGAAGVLLSRDSADPFSPKSLRAAMGSTYHLPIWIGDLPKELLKLKKQGFSCICGHLRGSEKFPLHGADTVLVIGNEGNGVSDAVASLCEQYRFPMRGKAESLNAAVFAALMMQHLNG